MNTKISSLIEAPILRDELKENIPGVALINVVVDGDYQFQGELPIGLASVGAFLRQHGYSVVSCGVIRCTNGPPSLVEARQDSPSLLRFPYVFISALAAAFRPNPLLALYRSG